MRGTNYKKRIEKWNKSVEIHKHSPAHVDGIFGKPPISNYVVVRGTISIPSFQTSHNGQDFAEFPKKEEKKKKKKFSFSSLFLKRNFYFGTLSSLLILLNVIVPLIAFEAHILNVTATIKQRTCNVVTFDTDASGATIAAGQVIDSEYDAWGLTVSADNNHANIPDLAAAFGSDAPTGGDFDLGTPNIDFGGPGVGLGGGVGQPGENNRLERNLLVIAQDNVDANNDGLIDDPSDEPDGGWIWFTFDAPTRVESLRLVDIDIAGAKIDIYDGAEILDTTLPVLTLGDNSSQYVEINKEAVKKIGVWLPGEGAVDSLCFDPVEKPNMCDARSKGYWANNEGCSQGTGESEWALQINTFSNGYADIFATSTAAEICEYLWTPNCPSGNSREARLCKARSHLLADELNLVSGKLQLDAFIAGADDGDSAFNNLALTPFSTVQQAVGMIEAVLASPSSSKQLINNAGYVAQRIYEFYENENPLAPECIFDPDDVPQCLVPLNANVEINNSAVIEDEVTTISDTGGNSTDERNAARETINDTATTTSTGDDGENTETGIATSENIIENILNATAIEIGENSASVSTTTGSFIQIEISETPTQASGNTLQQSEEETGITDAQTSNEDSENSLSGTGE